MDSGDYRLRGVSHDIFEVLSLDAQFQQFGLIFICHYPRVDFCRKIWQTGMPGLIMIAI